MVLRTMHPWAKRVYRGRREARLSTVSLHR